MVISGGQMFPSPVSHVERIHPHTRHALTMRRCVCRIRRSRSVTRRLNHPLLSCLLMMMSLLYSLTVNNSAKLSTSYADRMCDKRIKTVPCPSVCLSVCLSAPGATRAAAAKAYSGGRCASSVACDTRAA